jgi:uncharacterized protein DUF3592
VRTDSGITTLFGPRPPATTVDPVPSPTPAITLRSVGRLLVTCAGLLLVLSGCLGFVQYLLQTQWTKSGAEVLRVQVYEHAHSSSKRGVSTFYSCRYTVAYRVAGDARQSQLDFGPIFATRTEAEIWAARFPLGSQIPIFYKPSATATLRFAGDPPPSYLTASGTMKLAGCLLLAGLLAMVASKQNCPQPSEPGSAQD